MTAAEEAEIRERLARLEKVLLIGNGHPSIMARVEAIDARLGVITKLLWLVAGQGVATIFGILYRLLSSRGA